MVYEYHTKGIGCLSKRSYLCISFKNNSEK